MPYKSQAQAAKMHILEKEGKIKHATINEFDSASKGIKLPKYAASKPKYKSPWESM